MQIQAKIATRTAQNRGISPDQPKSIRPCSLGTLGQVENPSTPTKAIKRPGSQVKAAEFAARTTANQMKAKKKRKYIYIYTYKAATKSRRTYQKGLANDNLRILLILLLT